MEPTIEISHSREAKVGAGSVRRALPIRAHRTIGAWCFLDHFGPEAVTPASATQIGPHPHIGLQTVTWLLDGELVHTDSLGSAQSIRPGQLNLMSAGHGIAHAEDGRDLAASSIHGVQLWVAQPDATRHGPSAFEHHGTLPRVDLGIGGGTATVMIGPFDGVESPARHDTPLVGVDLELRGRAEVPLDPAFEHGLIVLSGQILVDGSPVEADDLAYLGGGRSSVTVEPEGTCRAILVGGEPLGADILMWWNFVARDRGEVEQAWQDWETGADRFGPVRSTLDRIHAPRPEWLH